ncbi:MAG: hypothetical protein U1B30_08775 [Pseudomonadota bacterium]|nr:hypothetical protein [Pseudomonadota bacterium]
MKAPLLESETGTLLSSTPLPGNYHLLRLHLPQLSQTIAAGQQLRIEGNVLPVMRNHPAQQWIELLSSTLPSWVAPQATLHCAVAGEPFQPPHTAASVLLIGEALGLAPIIFLAERIKKERRHLLLVLLGFNGEIPFRPAPSRIMVDGLPAGVIATLPLLEDWSVAGRIAHTDEPPGCFGGDVVTLAHHWLQQSQSQPQFEAVKIYLSGNREMVEAGASLAEAFNLEYQTAMLLD